MNSICSELSIQSGGRTINVDSVKLYPFDLVKEWLELTAKEGVDRAMEAEQAFHHLKEKGVFVPISKIVGLDFPNPDNWNVAEEKEHTFDLKAMGLMEGQRMAEKLGATFSESITGKVVRRGMMKTLRTLPGDYVTLQSDGKEMFVRWSSVDIYAPTRKMLE